MDKTNVKTVVILTGMWGEKLQRVIDTMVKPYPGRFLVFTQIDCFRIDDANFSQEMVAQLETHMNLRASSVLYLADGTSINTISSASTKLAMSQNTPCNGFRWK